MTLNRQTAKTFFKSLDKYETIKELVERAVDPTSPSLLKSHEGNRSKLDDCYLEVIHDWKVFKRDLNQTEDLLNSVDENGVWKYEHNDVWLKKFKDEYCVLIERSDTALISSASNTGTGHVKEDEQKVTVSFQRDKKLAEELGSQMELLSQSITTSLNKLSSEITSLPDGSVSLSRIQMYKSDIAAIEGRIEGKYMDVYHQYICILPDAEVLEKRSMKDNFISTERGKIDNLLLVLNKKFREESPVHSVNSSFSSLEKKAEQSYLKKVDPPTFKGDIVEYSDFVRKWKAVVSKVGLSAESELDRLKDHIPEQAARALYGESTMTGAWSILDKLYGDKDLVANKLKIQLKSIKPRGRKEQDIVLDLVTEVNNIVLRMKALEMEQLLKVDNDFLSAIYRALPSKVQDRWLDYDKTVYATKWDAFMVFLERSREKALQSKALISTYEEEDACSIICKKCGILGHISKNCHSAKINSTLVSNGDSGTLDKATLKRQKRDECGKCPLCSSYHTYTRRKDKDEWPTDRMFVCDSYKKLSVKDRAAALEKYRCCPKCTSWKHLKQACPSGASCNKVINGKTCGGSHSSTVCGSGSVYCGVVKAMVKSSALHAINSSSQGPDCGMSLEICPDIDAVTLLLLQDVEVLGCLPARTCWDNGSNRVLITHKYAISNKLRSQKIVFRLDVVGTSGKAQDGVLYELVFVDNDGSSRKIWGFGVESIMEPPEPVNLKPVQQLFPHLPGVVFEPLARKPVDVLVGNNFFQLHPDGGQGRDACGDLKALQSRYGSGWLIGGTHPLLSISSHQLTLAAQCIAKVNRCEIVPEGLPGFWEGDALGVLPPRRCERCKGCASCSDPALIHSRQEEEELEALRKNISLVNGILHVNYVFKKDPACLPNNRSAAIKIASKLADRLIKSGHYEYYNGEIQKYLDRGGAVRLSKEEIEQWKGPVNYISHHGVEKPSATTPLRIVTNSSLNNAGNSLNGCLIRGPNSLNPMLDIALRFRCHECAIVFDLTKAYNSLKTGQIERHLRRFIWRFSPEEEWTDFAFDSVAFGDLPSANFLELGRNLTADAGYSIDPEAAEKIKRDSYVDDNISGGTYQAVARMKGEKLADGTFNGTCSQILSKGNLKIKTIVTSGEQDVESKSLLGDKVLGYGWNATEDIMDIKFPVYLSNKKKKPRMLPALTLETCKLIDKSKITKRVCLGITNSFGDFMGLASPFTIRFKLLMKELFQGDKDQQLWDSSVPSEARDAWIQLIVEAVESDSLCFPRSTRPKNAVGMPSIVGFCDGAFPAYAACVYTRWLTDSGDFVSTLLWAKARVTPLVGFTVPRSELSGAVLLSRMATTTVKALSLDSSMHPESLFLLSDSKCTISVAEKSSSSLKPFFHNRVCELVENLEAARKICPVEDLHYICSDLNPADLATRGGVKLKDIGPDSFWQRGPFFLSWGRDRWPVSRDFIPEEIPEVELRTRKTFSGCLRAKILAACSKSYDFNTDGSSLPKLWSAISNTLLYSNSILKVKRILARLIRGWRLKANGIQPSLDNIGDPTAEDMQAAERLILLTAMPYTAQAYLDKKLDSLCPRKDGHIIVTTGRFGEKSLERLLGVSSLPILMPQSRAAHLFMVRAHAGEHGMDHKSVAETLAKSRQCVWVVKGRILAKKVVQGCFVCRKVKKNLSGQLMANLKEESLTVCRPWSFISLDFAGPVLVRGAVNKRAKMKSWIIVYCCRSTKAVCLLATCGYDTGSFLLKHEEYVANHGAPISIVSDRGTQLVSAGKILAEKASDSVKDQPGKWDWRAITASNSASSWSFVPIGSQHYNGLPESAVKVLKKSLSLALHPGVELSYPELVTLLAKISYSINARPLGLASVSGSDQQEDNMLPITPNMLLLGRSSDVSPPLIYSEDNRFSSRLAYVAQVEQTWWNRWYKNVLPTLFPYRRWKKRRENIKVGDVVMLYYQGHFKDDYCMAKVIEVFPDSEGLVRTCRIAYRKRNPKESASTYKSKPLHEEKVAVHRLHPLGLSDDQISD